MKLTRGGEYGILGVLYLAQQDDGKISVLSTIAKAQDIPPLFLAKVFQALTKVGVVKSHRGVKGGFSLRRAASEITIKDVIEAIEGPIKLNRDTASTVRAVWDEAQEKVTDVLSRSNFAELATAERKMAMTHADSRSPGASRGTVTQPAHLASTSCPRKVEHHFPPVRPR